jgi:hypothetical protein
MAQRKFRMNELRQMHARLGELIAESDSTYANGTELESTGATDSAPRANSDGVHVLSYKEMAALIPGYNRHLKK